MASSALHGSAMPSPFASTPQRSQVEGMNCIQPIAPAELGPMLRPKSDSILLIAASTGQGMPYIAPAPIQRVFSVDIDICESPEGSTPNAEAGGAAGVGADTGAADGVDGTTANVPP